MRVITPISYRGYPPDTALAREIMRRLNLDPLTVTLIELDETGVVIEQCQLDENGRPVRTADGDVQRHRWRVS
jgi:hypothetical protein